MRSVYRIGMVPQPETAGGMTIGKLTAQPLPAENVMKWAVSGAQW